MKLPAPVAKAFSAIDAMSLRERALVAGTVLALIWALWDNVLMQPLSALESAKAQQRTALAEQVRDLNASIQTLAVAQGADPDAENRKQLAEATELLAQLDGTLRELTADLVEPTEMAGLLESMLGRTEGLRLVSMSTLPAEEILSETLPTGYYRHGLKLVVRGGFPNALRYLQSLERLGWRFLWDSVELEVVGHPVSDITIVVYTLGRQKGVLGV